MDAIVTYDLAKQYGSAWALRGLNLQVPQGSAVACVGRENSGKTTLIRLLSGLYRPTSGECTVLGLSPAFETERLHALVGMVLGMAVCYAVGTAWFMVQSGSGLAQSLTLCVIPFVLPDLVKAVLATALARTLRRRAPALFKI